jgi:hypothetical protein
MCRQISNPQGYAELLSRFEYRRIVSIGLISLKMARVLSMYPVLLLEAEQSCTTRKWDDADLQIKKHVVSVQAFEINPQLFSSGSQQGCLKFCKVCAVINCIPYSAHGSAVFMVSANLDLFQRPGLLRQVNAQ